MATQAPPPGTKLDFYVQLFEIDPQGKKDAIGETSISMDAENSFRLLRETIFNRFKARELQGHDAFEMIIKLTPDGTPLVGPAAFVKKVYMLPFQQDAQGRNCLYVEVPALEEPSSPTAVDGHDDSPATFFPTPEPGSMRFRFLQLLKRRPNTNRLVLRDVTWRSICVLFADRLLLVLESQLVDAAHSIFDDARAVFANTTVEAFARSGLGVVGEPFKTLCSSDSSDFYQGYETRSGKPVIIKCPRRKALYEIGVCEDLKLEENKVPGLVPLAVVRIRVREQTDDSNEEDLRHEVRALVMPRFAGTLKTAFQLGAECVVHHSKSIIMGLNWLHERGYVHMDVKVSNVFVSSDGNWYLGDFGSCVRVNNLIQTTTNWCYPELLTRSDKARFTYDWYMLAVAILLVTQATRGRAGHDLQAWEADDGEGGWGDQPSRVDDVKIKAAIAQTQHEPLRKLLGGLVECKTAVFDD